MSTRRKKSGYFLAVSLSVSAHAVLLGVFLFHWKRTPSYRITGRTQVMQARLVKLFKPEPKKSVLVAAKAQEHIIKKYPHTHPHATPKHRRINFSPRRQAVIIKKMTGKQYNKLIGFLYREIDAQKEYPEIAKTLHQEGRVELQFTISPLGKISHLKILHSSNYQALDQAAKSAVAAAQPFSGIGSLMKHEKNITLSLLFGLNS